MKAKTPKELKQDVTRAIIANVLFWLIIIVPLPLSIIFSWKWAYAWAIYTVIFIILHYIVTGKIKRGLEKLIKILER
jgi:hypothetical protein